MQRARAQYLSVASFLLFGCGTFEPTVTLVDLQHETAIIDVAAPEGSHVRADGTEGVTDATGHARLDVSVAAYSETASNPRVSIFVDEDAWIGARSAYLTLELPVRLDVLHHLPTDAEGFVFLPLRPGLGLRVAAIRGASITVLGQPIVLDEWGVGPMVSDLRQVVLASAPSLLTTGGTLSIPATLTLRDGSTRHAEAPLAISAAGVEGQLDLWLDRPVEPAMLAGAARHGLVWRRTHEPLEPALVLLGSSSFLGTRYAATETVNSTTVRVCAGGAPLVSDERVVVIRDMTSGAEVARRAFGPGRIGCPAVFSLAESQFRYTSPHPPIQAWLEDELARLESAP